MDRSNNLCGYAGQLEMSTRGQVRGEGGRREGAQEEGREDTSNFHRDGAHTHFCGHWGHLDL